MLIAKAPSGKHRKGLLSEGLWVGGGHAISAVGLLVGVRLLTEALKPEEFGRLALGLTIVLFGQQIVGGPLVQALLRFFSPAVESRSLPSYLRASGALLKRASRLISALIGLAILISLLGQARWGLLVATALSFSLISTLASALGSMQNAARQRIVVAWHQVLASWLRFALALFLIHLTQATGLIALVGYCLASALVLVSQLVFFRRRIVGMARDHAYPNSNDIDSWMMRMQSYAWPFTTWGVLTWAQLASDRWALELFTDTANVGIYSAVYQIGYMPLMMLSGMLTQLLVPILFGMVGDASSPERVARTRRRTFQSLNLVLMMTLVAAALAAIFHRVIAMLLLSDSYHHASWALPFMVLAGGLFAGAQIATQIPLIELDARSLIKPKLFTSSGAIAANLAGAYFLGIAGVIAATLLFSLAYLAWILRVSGWRVGFIS